MSLREIERESIRLFLEKNIDRIHGQVLDFGAGKQPYREMIEATRAEYTPFDSPAFPASTTTKDTRRDLKESEFDTVICTQVLQYVDSPIGTLKLLNYLLVRDGWLLITGPTNWPVIEDDDKWRFTTHGIALLLIEAGFINTRVETRAEVTFERERWALGWQAIARA